MRAIVVDRWMQAGELTLSECALPKRPARHVLIEVEASPVSYALSLLVAGKYQRKPPLPFVPGNTAAGRVVACDSGSRFRIGDRVVAATEWGGLAEYCVAHEANVYGISDATSFAAATAFNTAYNSVLAALTWPHLLNVKSGETLLVLGAAGGTGSAAVEIGRILGASVIASASTPEKRAIAREFGAHEAVGADPATLRDEVMALTNGRGVNAVLDPVGGALFHEALRAMDREARIVPLGFASGEIPRIPVNLLLVKNISIRGLYMGYYKIDARDRYEAQVRALFEQLGHWGDRGLIRPRIAATFGLADIVQAFAAVLDRAHVGHVIVEPKR